MGAGISQLGAHTEVAPVTPERQQSPEAARAHTTEIAHTQGSLLQEQIKADTAQEIQNITGIAPTSFMSDINELIVALKSVADIFKKTGQDTADVADLFAPLDMDREEVSALLNDPENHTESDAPAEAEVEDTHTSDAPESRAAQPKWKPSEQRKLDRKISYNQRYIAKRANEIITQRNYLPLFDKVAQESGVSKSVLVAFAMKESSMNPLSVNGESGATGLSQVMDGTLDEYRADGHPNADPKDPETGIRIIAYLAKKSIKQVHNAVTNGYLTATVKKRDPNNPKKIIKTKFRYTMKPEYEIAPDDVASLYLTHNSGVAGYIAYRVYKDALVSGDQKQIENAKKGLQYWQEDLKANGLHGWERRAQYADEVAEVAYHWENLNQTTN